MSFAISIKTKGFKSAIQRIANVQTNIKVQVPQYIQSVVTDADLVMTQNLASRVYGQAPSPTYKRTGSAQRGRKIKTLQKSGSLKMDSRIGGAARAYTAFLNKNRKIRKLNTRFWDDGIISAKSNFSRRNKILARRLLGE